MWINIVKYHIVIIIYTYQIVVKNFRKNSSLLKTIDDPFSKVEQRLKALETIVLNQDFPLNASGSQTGKIDLHLHSNSSDGFWTPCGLFLEAYRCGMDTISLTDHDCFDGIVEGFLARDLLHRVTGSEIGFIPGIELSTNYTNDNDGVKEIHVLGYFPSRNFEEFKSYLNKIDIYSEIYLEAFKKCRILRIYEMVQNFNQELPSQVGGALLKLTEFGDPIPPKTIKRGLRRSVSPGRLLTCTGIYEIYHFYMNGKIDEIQDQTFSKAYLKGLVEFMRPYNSPHDVMEKYFGSEQPSAKVGYIGKTEDPEWAVKMIQTMGGIPVLAHPILYPDILPELLEELCPSGLMGVEVISSNTKSQNRDRLDEMKQFIKHRYPNLVITAGSDCHGHSVDRHLDYTPENPMGLSTEFEIFLKNHQQRIVDLLKLN